MLHVNLKILEEYRNKTDIMKHDEHLFIAGPDLRRSPEHSSVNPIRMFDLLSMTKEAGMA